MSERYRIGVLRGCRPRRDFQRPLDKNNPKVVKEKVWKKIKCG